MWEPVGPLPASVYWRRRWVALAVVIVVFMVFGWSFAALTAPSSDDAAEAATTRPASRAAMTEAAPDPATSATAAPSASGTPVVSTSPGTQSPDPSQTGQPDTTPPTDEQVRPDDTPRPPVAVPPSLPVPATGPVPCADDMLTVAAEIDRPDHKVGDRPVLRLVVTNVSDQPCVRDLDGSQQEIVVWSGDGATRLWSSNDCVNPASTDLRTLVPGQPVAFAVTWSGKTSNPGCTAPRRQLPAGAYRVVTRLAQMVSSPTPFLLMN
ncbi:MucR family transcriptional regulator [Pseudonocardia acidicola]|uniref:MucR family transcriptional regulator n=1 Tax=Pseudonocardia acidicola TaxID=2724939 RepID=A0ABX1SFE4_9PSEU|nr:MucR family transcriptional regulator [Pseudonocardia acidicola]NMH99213.1 MucR family transcriptional regulator [Pseudonocardia acidicola]